MMLPVPTARFLVLGLFILPVGTWQVLSSESQRKGSIKEFRMNCDEAGTCTVALKIRDRVKNWEIEEECGCKCEATNTEQKPVLPECPPGFFKGKNLQSCYYINSTVLNWYEAVDFCETLGADLLAIENNLEQIVVTVALNKFQSFSHSAGKCYFTSGTDMGRENKYIWFSTGNSIYLNFWSGGEPNNYKGHQHFLVLHPQSFLWTDEYFNASCGFVCEIPLS